MSEIYRFAGLELDTSRFQVRRAGKALAVQPQVFDVLAYLLQHRDRVIGKAELLDEETPAACLTVDWIAYDDVGQFVEIGRHLYHAAHYSIQSSLVV